MIITDDYIHKQLENIRQTIRPFFVLKASNNRNANNAVTRDKLTDMWLNKRKKAIVIIKNDGVWPNNINVDISIERNEEFYQSSEKYTISDEFTADENRYFDRSNTIDPINIVIFFTLDEVKEIVDSCPMEGAVVRTGSFMI